MREMYPGNPAPICSGSPLWTDRFGCPPFFDTKIPLRRQPAGNFSKRLSFYGLDGNRSGSILRNLIQKAIERVEKRREKLKTGLSLF